MGLWLRCGHILVGNSCITVPTVIEYIVLSPIAHEPCYWLASIQCHQTIPTSRESTRGHEVKDKLQLPPTLRSEPLLPTSTRRRRVSATKLVFRRTVCGCLNQSARREQYKTQNLIASQRTPTTLPNHLQRQLPQRSTTPARPWRCNHPPMPNRVSVPHGNCYITYALRDR